MEVCGETSTNQTAPNSSIMIMALYFLFLFRLVIFTSTRPTCSGCSGSSLHPLIVDSLPNHKANGL